MTAGMGYHRSSGSSTATETKAPAERFEYDDRNHSMAPSTRKFSTSAADLIRRNASGESCDSKHSVARD